MLFYSHAFVLQFDVSSIRLTQCFGSTNAGAEPARRLVDYKFAVEVFISINARTDPSCVEDKAMTEVIKLRMNCTLDPQICPAASPRSLNSQIVHLSP